MTNTNYSSSKVLKKTIFNIGFQIFPILIALILTPILINGLGKDVWAKYSIGISLIFLSNYFSFGIGPTLNRRVSEIIGQKKYHFITHAITNCISFSYLLAITFFVFFQILLLVLYNYFSFSVLTSIEDFKFYFVIIFTFTIVLIMIPYRSILESFSDFYFLAIIRAVTSSMLFFIPTIFLFLFDVSLLLIGISLLSLYAVLFLIYYLRVRKFQNSMNFLLPNVLSGVYVKNLFKIGLDFINETFYFSLFFLTSATVLFFDRFYYPLFYSTEIISDQVTMLDLFNRVSILTGTISLVYFSAISVWYQEKQFELIKQNLRKQIIVVSILFLMIIFTGYFIISDILHFWLGDSYSEFINSNAFNLLIATFLVNFTILLVRPLQSIGLVKPVSLFLLASTLIYVVVVYFLGAYKKIELHYVALSFKAVLDIFFLVRLLKNKRVL